ncbi:MAG: c-type cytochrome [Verrucomicrobiales bacterium]|nr:c-type cytochrome [Verrucomicrobiales bacterium]
MSLPPPFASSGPRGHGPSRRAAAHLLLLALLLSSTALRGAPSPPTRALDANRLTYLDGEDPFHPGLHFPRLTTPQWVGEPGVDVVVTLGIDDMRDSRPYEAFLRPILERLKQIDGRAPLSIFCNAVSPGDPQFTSWLAEGVSLEVHTLSHPCPILAKGDFEAAWNTFHGGVSLLSSVPGNLPVAFRTPCCDSINSPSPRVYAELFRGVNDQGQFLRLDSSVVMVLSTNDPALPRALVQEPDGRSRFGKYLPFPSFVTTVRDYPYPWVIGKLCWEFPCVAPSDWEAQNLLGKNHPTMLADWKAALDAIALKQGTFNSVFHPHGWSSSTQWVEFIDHAVNTLGARVRFLNYREAHDRLVTHLGAGEPLRAADGSDNGVRLLDLNDDGFLDVIIANDRIRRTRVWQPDRRAWLDTTFPTALVTRAGDGRAVEVGARFGIVHDDGAVSVLLRHETGEGAWTFRGGEWQEDRALLTGLNLDGAALRTATDGRDGGVRFRDMDADGRCELLVGNPEQQAIFEWDAAAARWKRSEAVLPPGVRIVDADGRDAGTRFADINEDGFDDLVFSNEERFGVWLYQKEYYLGWSRGWTRKALAGERHRPSDPAAGGKPPWVETPPDEIPPFVRPGPHPHNGAWIHSRQLWVQNEHTAHLPDLVDRRSFDDLLRGVLPPALSPEESRRRIQVRSGFEVDLIAAEPLVRDPVAIDWDAAGRLWVAEMRDYPLGLDGQGKPGGAIKVLEDLDGDGVMDRATPFLEDLGFPSGVMPWRKGVLVSAAPSVFYAEDTDGDGRADRRRPLLTGFVEGNQQHRVNGFALGLDGWVYGANGDSGGEIRSEITGQTASLRGRDFRFKPDTGEFETIEGQTQYGRFRDDWGHWFGNANYTWLWHYPWPAASLARNPNLLLRDSRVMLADAPGRNLVFPISRMLPRPNQVGDENTVTSACGGSAYRDDLFGPEFSSSVFIAEPTENLVHREVLRREGAGLAAGRAEGEATNEFLASTDAWFRPVQTRSGPDGALYVVDMYRLVIEHPEWIPPDLKARVDLRAGTDRGRIYRVRPQNAKLRALPNLAATNAPGWAAAMRSPNGWTRDTAQRLLMENPTASVAPILRDGLRNAADPRARAQSLATLGVLGQVTDEDLLVGLGDSHPEVQALAARTAEAKLATGRPDALSATVARALAERAETLPATASASLAFALGLVRDPAAGSALVTLARRFRGDRVLETAVLASASKHALRMIEAFGTSPNVSARVLGGVLGEASTDAPSRAAGTAALLRWQSATDDGLLAAATAAFLDALQRRGQLDGATLQKLKPILARALAAATRPDTQEDARLDALRALEAGGATLPEAPVRLAALIQRSTSPALVKAALKALGRSGLGLAGGGILARWSELGPEARTLTMEAFLAAPESSLRVLEALGSGTLPRTALAPAARQRLQTHPDPAVKAKAMAVLGQATAARAEVLRGYATALERAGDARRGQALFTEHCAVCHRFQGAGIEVGPDLGLALDKTPAALLIAILDPNQAFEDRYTAYAAVRGDGREFPGILISESAASVTLRNAAGLEEPFLRSELTALRSTGRSLMPEGFELSLDPQAMSDLIAFLGRTTRTAPE